MKKMLNWLCEKVQWLWYDRTLPEFIGVIGVFLAINILVSYFWIYPYFKLIERTWFAIAFFVWGIVLGVVVTLLILNWQAALHSLTPVANRVRPRHVREDQEEEDHPIGV